MSQGNNQVYFADPEAKKVSVYNTEGGVLIETSVTLGGGLNGIAVSPDGSKLYVSVANASVVLLHTTDLSKMAGRMAMPKQQAPVGLVASNDNESIYVLGHSDNTIYWLNIEKNIVINSYNVAAGAKGNPIAISPDGETLAVANNNHGISLINAKYGTLPQDITLGIPEGYKKGSVANIIFTDGGFYALVSPKEADSAGWIAVFAMKEGEYTQVGSITVDGLNFKGMAVSPLNEDLLYITADNTTSPEKNYLLTIRNGVQTLSEVDKGILSNIVISTNGLWLYIQKELDYESTIITFDTKEARFESESVKIAYGGFLATQPYRTKI